jgi:hypothetical protein
MNIHLKPEVWKHTQTTLEARALPIYKGIIEKHKKGDCAGDISTDTP